MKYYILQVMFKGYSVHFCKTFSLFEQKFVQIKCQTRVKKDLKQNDIKLW